MQNDAHVKAYREFLVAMMIAEAQALGLND